MIDPAYFHFLPTLNFPANHQSIVSLLYILITRIMKPLQRAGDALGRHYLSSATHASAAVQSGKRRFAGSGKRLEACSKEESDVHSKASSQ